jgi:hypothetical protein
MNILYLHGLESKLSNEKRVLLEKYGKVIAPDMDYTSNPNMIASLFSEYHNYGIDVIIGSSMGGFAGYYLANSFGICALLYNPALPYRGNTEQIQPTDLPVNNPKVIRIVLGGQDTVIKAKDNLEFLAQHISSTTDFSIVIRKDLGHQIPVDVFEMETIAFFDSIC